MGAADIAQGFRDFRPFLGHCRFRDCSHGPDPGCALVAAVAAGQLQPRRLHSYHLLIRALGANG
jgi:ribosome biogenesis GTPase